MTGWSHGTMSGYKRHGCRCEPCADAHRAYNRDRYLKYKCGVRLTVPAEPVRRHVQRLLDNGWTYMQLEAASGIHRTGIRQLIEGHRKTGRPSQTLAPHTAKALLSQPLRPVFAQGAFYPRFHVTRRLQALQAIGWTAQALGDKLGITGANVVILMERDAPARGSTCLAVADLYDRLCMTPGPSSRVRVKAARKGWAPPLAWDDIDDPNETPTRGPAQPARTPSTQVADDAHELWTAGTSPEEIATRLGKQLTSIERAFYRSGRVAPWIEATKEHAA